MRDRFDYDSYWSLIDRIAASHQVVRFRDFSNSGTLTEPFVILRHDVDYSPAAALRLARQERERNVASTYFLLPNSRYYNLLSPEHVAFARELTALGHEVGLHYDVNSFAPFPRSEWLPLLKAQARLLESLSGQPVLSIAIHQPGLNPEDPFRDDPDGEFTNAYDRRFIVDATYVSDSCRAWRDVAWQMFETGFLPPRLHLALHPINWSEQDRPRQDVFRAVHEEIVWDTQRACADLLDKIGRHSGVLEHERRTTRAAGAQTP